MSMDDPGKHEPVRVYESEATDDRFLIYGTAEGAQVELRFDGDALWMTQAQIADLFGRDVSVISRHIANVIEDGELGSSPDLHFLQIKGPANRAVTAYSLDMVISVGYRVSSAQATLFRRWATAVLIRFATQGFVVDVARMKAAGEQDRIRELREIVRDIRSEEANLYAEIRAICALCQDYDPASDAWRTFYRNTQAKFCFAVTSHTPAEVLMARADAAAPDMGLQTWKGERVTASDVTVAKNFLTPMEVRELNRLTDILLSIFEDQLEIGRLTTMAEATALLDAQLKNLGRVVLTGGGRVAKDQADRHARLAYKIYDDARKADERSRVEREYAQLRKTASDLPSTRPRRKPS